MVEPVESEHFEFYVPGSEEVTTTTTTTTTLEYSNNNCKITLLSN